MAGNPKMHAMVADLCLLARAEGLDTELEIERPGEWHEEDLALAFVVAWFSGLAPADESGTLSGLARRLGVSRRLVWVWLKQGNGDRHKAYVRARAEGSTFLVEDAMHVLDTADYRESGIASARANYRKWLASVLSPGEFAQQKSAGVAISIEHLHLAAHANRKAIAAVAVSPHQDRSDTVTIAAPQVEE